MDKSKTRARSQTSVQDVAVPEEQAHRTTRSVIRELEKRRDSLRAIDGELSGSCGLHRLTELRRLKADLLAEIEALEVAMRYAKANSEPEL